MIWKNHLNTTEAFDMEKFWYEWKFEDNNVYIASEMHLE